MTYKDNNMTSTNHTESFDLLLTGSDSGSEIPDFTIPKRKIRIKRKTRQGNSNQRKSGFGLKNGAASFCNSACSTSLCVSFMMVVVAVLMVLIWFVIQFRFQLDQLNSKFNNIEASSNGMPQELHNIHNKLNNLQKNYTDIEQKIATLNVDVKKINEQVQELQETSNSIKSSITAAPLIKKLPDDVMKLTENVATIGSKITNVEDKLDKLKAQHSDFDAKHKSFSSAVKQLQDSLDDPKRPQTPKPSTEPNNIISQLSKNMKSLENEFDNLNSSIANEVKAVSMETANISEIIKTFQTSKNANPATNLNASITNFIVNTVKKSLIINTNSDKSANNVSISEILNNVNTISELYLNLLLKLNQSTDVLASKNSTLVVNDLIKKFVDMYSHSAYFVNLSGEFLNLNSTVGGLQHNQSILLPRMDQAFAMIKEISAQKQETGTRSTEATATSQLADTHTEKQSPISTVESGTGS